MIEFDQVIDGRAAAVAYLTDGFKPAAKDDATLLKIIFEDGIVAFAQIVKADDAGN